MTLLLSLHLLALGIWIGVVAAEFVIEFDGMKDDVSYIKAAKFHFVTDIWIEIPAFMIVLLTGVLMMKGHHLEGLFLIKVIFGVLAVGFNIVCVYAVFRRRQYAMIGDIQGMRSTNPVMRLGSMIIPTFLVAFFLGMYFIFT